MSSRMDFASRSKTGGSYLKRGIVRTAYTVPGCLAATPKRPSKRFASKNRASLRKRRLLSLRRHQSFRALRRRKLAPSQNQIPPKKNDATFSRQKRIVGSYCGTCSSHILDSLENTRWQSCYSWRSPLAPKTSLPRSGLTYSGINYCMVRFGIQQGQRYNAHTSGARHNGFLGFHRPAKDFSAIYASLRGNMNTCFHR